MDHDQSTTESTTDCAPPGYSDQQNASISAATVTAFLIVLWFLVTGYLNADDGFSTDDWMAFLYLFAIVWIGSFLLALCMMVPLAHVFKRTSPKVSMLVFLAVGFPMPFVLGVWVSSIPSPGDSAPIETETFSVIYRGIALGLIGAAASGSAWRSLRRRGVRSDST